MPLETAKCNLCGSDDLRIILNEYKADLRPPQVIYLYCNHCSFLTLNLDYEEWLPTYESGLQESDDVYFRRYSIQETSETWSVINDLLTLKKYYPQEVAYIINGDNKVIADIGCGVGGSLRAYQTLGWQTTGIEPGNRTGQYARDVLNLDVRSEYYSRESFHYGSLDMIHSYHTLEHIEFPYHFLSNFAYHLRPGGILYVETPNVLDTANLQLGFGHISLFSPGTLGQTLRACGFDVVHLFDRSYTGTFGVGMLARRREDIEATFFQDQGQYLPIDSLNWCKDSYVALKAGLAYAFWVGRSRKVTSISLPWRLIEITVKKYVAPLFRRLRGHS